MDTRQSFLASSVQFSSVQDGIYALGKVHLRSTPPQSQKFLAKSVTKSIVCVIVSLCVRDNHTMFELDQTRASV